MQYSEITRTFWAQHGVKAFAQCFIATNSAGDEVDWGLWVVIVQGCYCCIVHRPESFVRMLMSL